MADLPALDFGSIKVAPYDGRNWRIFERFLYLYREESSNFTFDDRIFKRSLQGNLHMTTYDPYVITCKLCACAQLKNDHTFGCDDTHDHSQLSPCRIAVMFSPLSHSPVSTFFQT